MGKMKSSTVVLLLAAGVCGQALAVPVTTWDYTVSSEFTAATFTADPPVGDTSIAPTVLTWGAANPAARSSLTINPAIISGSVDTFFGGGNPPATFVEPSNSLTHLNQVVGGDLLLTATLTATVTLDPTSPDLPPVPAGDLPLLEFLILFEETLNAGTCTVATSPTPCNDIFVLVGGFPNATFTYDGQEYFLNIFPVAGGALGVLPDEVCAAAGEGPGCFGFTTVENQSNVMLLGFTVSTLPLQVPEPGSLALVGLALLGAFLTRPGGRRRR
jgi:hypothetical protein